MERLLNIPVQFSSCTLRILEAASKYAKGGNDFTDLLEDCTLHSTQTIIRELSLEYLRLRDSMSNALALPDDLPYKTVIQVKDCLDDSWSIRYFSHYSTDEEGNRVIHCYADDPFRLREDNATVAWKWGRLLTKENLEYYFSSIDK